MSTTTSVDARPSSRVISNLVYASVAAQMVTYVIVYMLLSRETDLSMPMAVFSIMLIQFFLDRFPKLREKPVTVAVVLRDWLASQMFISGVAAAAIAILHRFVLPAIR